MDVFVMVGVPGTGKSAYARELTEMNSNSIRLSSDDYRIDMFGSLEAGNGKEQNVAVFQEMNSDLREAIKAKEVDYIVYDATNINRKRRRALYRNIKSWDKDAQVTIVYFSVPLKKVMEANDWRKDNAPDKVVPERTLHRMYKTLQVPRNGSDCDTFCVRGEQMFNYATQMEYFTEVVEDAKDDEISAVFLESIVAGSTKAMGLELYDIYAPHDCAPHHLEAIHEHIEMCLDNTDLTNRQLAYVSAFHDLGKAITKEMVTKNGTTKATYRGHADVSANYFLNYLYFSKLDFEDYVDVVEAVHQHMNHHQGISEKNIRNNNLNEKVLDICDKFGIIDSESRITGEETVNG